MNKFFHLLKTFVGIGTQIAAPIAKTLVPALGPLIDLIATGIIAAESAIPDKGAGQSRSTYAMSLVAAELPNIITSFERVTGKQIVDDAKFAAGVQALNNAVVQILNAFGSVPKASPVPVTVPAAQ